jgi:hypothetical protein
VTILAGTCACCVSARAGPPLKRVAIARRGFAAAAIGAAALAVSAAATTQCRSAITDEVRSSAGEL